MSENIEDLMDSLEERMMNTEDAMKDDFSKIRTGKASPALVEGIMVDYYGSKTRLKELAGISTPESRLIVVQPWDVSAVKAVEKAILASDIGISPVSDGKILRLPMPEIDEERRKKLAKQVKTRTEDAKIALRNIRRDGNEQAKKAEKASDITEDDLKNMLSDIQEMTDRYIKGLEKVLVEKEKELLTI